MLLLLWFIDIHTYISFCFIEVGRFGLFRHLYTGFSSIFKLDKQVNANFAHHVVYSRFQYHN